MISVISMNDYTVSSLLCASFAPMPSQLLKRLRFYDDSLAVLSEDVGVVLESMVGLEERRIRGPNADVLALGFGWNG